jgi:predicted HNH restriction endonuclease
VRFRLLGRRERQWLTLFVVTTTGKFYCGWLYRWHEEGFPRSIGRVYQNDIESAVNHDVVYGPSGFRNAVPLKEIKRSWPRVIGAVKVAIKKLRHAEKQLPASKIELTGSAIEGLATEIKMTRLGRSRSLRESARVSANGVCAVCRRDFKSVLAGRGTCVLQVHHIKQLSARDTPTVTRLKDLVVVCANCHMLLHFVDRGRPLSPSDLRARLRHS